MIVSAYHSSHNAPPSQAVYAYAAFASAQDPSSAPPEKGKPGSNSSIGPEYRSTYLHEQIARLKAIKTILLALEVRFNKK